MTDTEIETNRRGSWFTLFVLNLIALVSFLVQVKSELGTLKGSPRYIKWAVSSLSITFSLSCLAVLANFVAKSKFANKASEGGLIFIILAFWAAVLPAIMNPDNELAVGSMGMIENANLYFFSFLSLIWSLVIFADYLKTTGKASLGKKNEGFKCSLWAGLVLTSFVVMVSSARICEDVACQDTADAVFSKRTKWAVSLGLISAVVAGCFMFLGRCLPVLFDMILSALMLVGWIFGIIFITFGGGDSPGSNIGTLYFFTWGSFILATYVFADSFSRFMRRNQEEETTPEKEDKPEEKPEEPENKAGEPLENVDV